MKTNEVEVELRPPGVAHVREAFVTLWGSLGTFWGVSPTTARIFGWLFARSEAAGAEEIMDALELSRGAVSMACRELREWGLVTSERLPGSRRIGYRAESDLEKVTRHVVRIRKQREWDPILENLRDWIPELQEDPSPDAQVLRDRLVALERLVGLADSVVDSFLRGGVVSNLALRHLVRAPNRRAVGPEGSALVEVEEAPRPGLRDVAESSSDDDAT